jgi:hypothetical protein
MNNNNINEPSKETMNTIRKYLKSSYKEQRLMIESFKRTPFIQKLIIGIIFFGLIIIIIRFIFNRVKDINRFNPYYLETINNISEPYNVFNGSVVNSNCLNNDCANTLNYSNSSNSCCIINKNNFKEERSGVMTYNFWLYIYSFNNNNNNNNIDFNNIDSNDDSWKHIWHKGNGVIEGGNNFDNTLIQYPGVWLSPNLESLVIDFNNGEDISEKIQLNISKFNKWVNYSIVLNNNIVNIYENGKLENTVMLNQKIISSHNYNVYLGSQGKENNGFPGYLAYFSYFNESMNSDKIYDLYLHYKKKMDKYIKLENNYLNSQMLEPILITDKNMN